MDDQKRFDSWKEIALYAKRSVKTCRRWARELEFPVHRIHKAIPRSGVFAYKDEIDRWFRSR